MRPLIDFAVIDEYGEAEKRDDELLKLAALAK